MKKYYLHFIQQNLIFLLLTALTTGCSKLVSFSTKPINKPQPTSAMTVPQEESTPNNQVKENIPSFPIFIQPYQITNYPKTQSLSFTRSEPTSPPLLPSFDSHLPFYLPLIQQQKPHKSWMNDPPLVAQPIALSYAPAITEAQQFKASEIPTNLPAQPIALSYAPAITEAQQFKASEIPTNLPTKPIALSYAPAITEAQQFKASEIPTNLPAQPIALSYAPAVTEAQQFKASEIPTNLPAQPIAFSYAPAITEAQHFKVSEELKETPPPPPLVAFDLNISYLLQNMAPHVPTFNLPKSVPEVIEQRPEIVERRSQHELQDTFMYDWSSETFYQPIFDKNKNILSFKASNERGFNIDGLQATDLMLIENDKEVHNYTLSSSSQSTHQGLDLVFVINNSGSMKSDVNLIKENIAHLVRALERSQLIARLCLVTFIDQVTKRCDRFVTDDPLTSQNENLIAFLDDISKLQFRGGGGLNTDNALEGLLVAAQRTPWQIGHQRMLVLATDARFWINIDPRLSHIKGFNYNDVLHVLNQTGVQVFTMTYDYGGFSKNYFSSPSIVEATHGQWFDLRKLRQQEITIESIVDQVRNQLDTIYRIEYFVEDNIGFDPYLTLDERRIVLSPRYLEDNHNIHIEIQDRHSNMPEGKPDPQSQWLLNADKYIQEDNVFVTINGQQETDFFIEDGFIVFGQPPEEGSEIHIQYELGHLIDNVKWHPLVLESDDKHKSAETDITNMSLYLNGRPALFADFTIEPSASGQLHLRLNESVFADEDPFAIREFGQLDIFFSYELVSVHSN